MREDVTPQDIEPDYIRYMCKDLLGSIRETMDTMIAVQVSKSRVRQLCHVANTHLDALDRILSMEITFDDVGQGRETGPGSGLDLDAARAEIQRRLDRLAITRDSDDGAGRVKP